MLTQDKLKELLHYDPETGIFRWRVSCTNSTKPWSIAGYIAKNGYVHMSVFNKRFLAHRIAWLYMTGELPEEHIDHIDGNPSNNSWKNLRAATHKQNCENFKLFKSNSSGFRGVSFTKQTNRWRGVVKNNYKYIHVGYFDTAEEAAKAAAAKRAELFTHDTGRDKNMNTCQNVSAT